MTVQLTRRGTTELLELIRLERLAFAAKIRAARAVLGLSQSELASRAGLTQRAVHKLERGETEPRRATARAIEETWRVEGLEFEDIGGGGFRVTVRGGVLANPPGASPSHPAKDDAVA